ncbi:hypothetical protein ACHAWC_005568 [Mediolabrus comicus]
MYMAAADNCNYFSVKAQVVAILENMACGTYILKASSEQVYHSCAGWKTSLMTLPQSRCTCSLDCNSSNRVLTPRDNDDAQNKNDQ